MPPGRPIGRPDPFLAAFLPPVFFALSRGMPAAEGHAGEDCMIAGTTVFADGILDASVTSGVARLTLAQTGPDGKPVPAGQLIVPLVQLPNMVNGLSNLLKQVEAKMREQQTQQQAPAEADAPSAFRFG
jgi:hypothetical protein